MIMVRIYVTTDIQWYLQAVFLHSIPGGSVCGPNVLLTATVIVLCVSGRTKLVMSPSNGRWPPEC